MYLLTRVRSSLLQPIKYIDSPDVITDTMPTIISLFSPFSIAVWHINGMVIAIIDTTMTLQYTFFKKSATGNLTECLRNDNLAAKQT